jgi:hypothetical protein
MADFKDVIIRLQENRNSNVEAIETQTSALSETIVSTAKTQNRSFGQSLALQFKRNTGELSELKSIFTDQVEFAEEQADNQQAMLDEAKRNAAQTGGEGAAAANAITDAAEKSDKKTKGLFGGLMAGLGGMVGGVGLGGGALLAGAGILLGGGAMLLGELNDLDGKKVKENVVELISIKDEFDGLGDFFLTGGAFALAMTGIGVGLAALSVGAGAAAALEYFTKDIEWAKSVKTNVKELLSISDELGGNAELLKDGGAFTLAMTGIGIGLGVFGLGAGIAGLSNALTEFASPDFAKNIKDNVVTLLSISDEVGGKAEFLKEGGAFALSMLGIGTGLAAFGIGGGVAGITTALDKFADGSFGQGIYDNVVTLLSISDAVGGKAEMLKEGGAFALSMTGIAAGLAVFGVAAGVAGVGMGIANFSDGEFAQSIVDNVTTLLTISSLPGVLTDTAAFVGVMGGIAAGLVAFSAAEGFAAAIGYFTGGDTVDNIKTNVTKAMSILEDDNISPEKATQLKTTLQTVGEALSSFAGGELGASLKQVGTSILNFLSGKESPVEEMLRLAEKDEELIVASLALQRLSSALGKISALDFDGKKLNMKAFAEDLVESVPAIEAAIMGGKIDGGFFSSDIVYKGLGSDDIKFAEATENILKLRAALGESVEIPTDVSLSNRTNELGSNINGMGNNAQPIIVSNDSSSQVVNNSSSRANINVSKNTNPPDTTINAINPRMALYNP